MVTIALLILAYLVVGFLVSRSISDDADEAAFFLFLWLPAFVIGAIYALAERMANTDLDPASWFVSIFHRLWRAAGRIVLAGKDHE